MKKSFVTLLLLVFGSASLARAMNGLVYENGGGVGYINQSDSVQFKVLGSYFKDVHNNYQDITALKISLAKDIREIDEVKVYTGASYWTNLMGSSTTSYYQRTSLIFGVRQTFHKNFQIEIFVEPISYADGQTYNAKTDTLSVNTANSGWNFFRNGAIALEYFFD